MAKLSGLFDSFDNLDQIPIESIIKWLKPVPMQVQLENYIANRILYPKSVALSSLEMQIDLAILREALKINTPQLTDSKDIFLGNNAFLNINLRKIMIPEKFLSYVPDLQILAWVFIDALLLGKPRLDVFEDLWTIVVTDDVDEIVGSVLLPRLDSVSSELDVMMGQSSKQVFKIKAGSLIVIPCKTQRCQISYKLKGGHVLGKEQASLEVYGGRLGLVVDLRGSYVR